MSQETSGSTSTETRNEQKLKPGDAERFAHYVRKNKLTESNVTGKAVIALCGKVWIPVRNPEAFPVCPVCKEIYAQMKGGGDQS
ncbi:DUF3039 domain-containing protein [Flaviflexus salsibiostraticola]|uniref:DUF3039 domain-containing protein n=1 Tax=Flaviflexus salsibiostraticola TaxID=1282737 RepID=A0A3Q8WUU9_9ACTO|nr:DUF3039 domain-containing protein [Flaviflexus salsibiostraticola]AZN29625.1 DUF3039 domain-containing protein [Flaviflexus salsibiostraticola]